MIAFRQKKQRIQHDKKVNRRHLHDEGRVGIERRRHVEALFELARRRMNDERRVMNRDGQRTTNETNDETTTAFARGSSSRPTFAMSSSAVANVRYVYRNAFVNCTSCAVRADRRLWIRFANSGSPNIDGQHKLIDDRTEQTKHETKKPRRQTHLDPTSDAQPTTNDRRQRLN